MNLVSPIEPYDPEKSNLSAAQHELSGSAFGIIQAFRKECSEHDEDPDFDFDDALAALMKSFGFGKALAAHFMKSETNVPKDVEAVSHGVVCNLGMLEESSPFEDH